LRAINFDFWFIAHLTALRATQDFFFDFFIVTTGSPA
jgi:hypothetical protein